MFLEITSFLLSLNFFEVNYPFSPHIIMQAKFPSICKLDNYLLLFI